MAIVAGVDFGTLSVRVSIVDSERGLLESAVAEYPLHRKREDPEYATQSHDDHMRALAAATREAVKKAGIRGRSGAGHRARHHRLLGHSGRQKPAATRRVLPVVRSSRQRRGGGDHRSRAPRRLGSHQVVRRRLFLGVGIFQAPALAPAQSRQAIGVRLRLRALRHGGGHAVRHHRSEESKAQRLRHGPQVAVEPRSWAAFPRRAFWSRWILC